MRKLWYVFCWVFGYRAVFSKEPTHKALIVYARMHRTVATKKCVVCKKTYWVVGHPKGKVHFSVTCGRLKCYLEYHMNREKYDSKIKENRKGKSASKAIVESSYTRPAYRR